MGIVFPVDPEYIFSGIGAGLPAAFLGIEHVPAVVCLYGPHIPGQVLTQNLICTAGIFKDGGVDIPRGRLIP